MPTTTPFNNLITFSRGSNATLTGPNGLIQWAPNNLLTHSEQFDNAAWVKGGVSITANNAVAPDGTTTADLLTGTGATPRVYQLATLVSGVSYTATCYVKQGTSTSIGFDAININAGPVFTFATRTWSVLSAQFTAASFQELADGWFRLIITFTNNTTSAGPGWYVSGNTTAWLWGAQLEIGSTATTYNATTVKNLLGFSEAFDNAAWTKTRASIVTGAQANPINGLFNAQKLMEDTTASNSHFAGQSFTAVSTTTPYTFSVYAKAAGRTTLWLVHANATSISFDLVNGTCDVGGVITNVGSGWYRCSVTANAPDLLSRSYSYRLGAPSATYTGDGNSGVYIYGAQLSDSASLDPYVPTPGAAPSSTAFYGPRFDFDPVTRAPRGLLVEEQRTNLTLRSEEFDNASWSKVQLNTTGTPAWVNQTASPDGLTTADKLIPTAVSAQHYVAQAATVTAAAHTLTAYAKAAEYGFCVLSFYGATTTVTDKFAVFDLATGAATDVAAGVTASAVNAGNGWYRLTITFTMLAAASVTQYIFASNASTYAGATFTGDGISGIFIWGAQLEAGAFATSYIPTVASTVTRSADVATITGQNFAQWYRQDEGAFVALFDSYLVDTNTRSALSAYAVGATSNNILFINAVQRQFQINNAGNQADLDGGTPASGAIIKAAGAYRLNDFALSLDAGSVVTDTVGTVPTVDALGIGISSLGLTPVNGHIRSIRFIPARAADFQLQAL